MAVADAECQEDELLASFPNLRSLERVAPPEDWGRTALDRLPPEVNSGVLNNGLTYFVQENKEPRARAELFLVVGFGSLVEEEEERGIAHIIEHLGFSATKAYENHAIVKFLESIGAPFGACQNAYTSFDRTVYTLHVPTDKEGIVKESLTVLREFAYYTRISQEDLDKERKVVLEEWRESRNSQGRLMEQYIQALCKGCKWCDRLPIGKEEVIRNVGPETLREFYRRFYHPARMAVIAVGDFDGTFVGQTIKELFDVAPGDIEPLRRGPMAPERPMHAVPESDGVTVASSTDPELSFAQGMVDCKRPKLVSKSLADCRRRLTENLFHMALSSRLLKLTVEPRGARNFFSVGTDTGEPVPTLSTMNITIAPLPGRMRQALHEIVLEIERVKRLGFHAAEVSRAKRSVLAQFEEDYIERAQRPSDAFAEEYVSLFLDEQPVPGVEKFSRIAVTLIPSISCEEVARVAAEFNFEKNVVVKICTPPFSVRNLLYSCWSVFQACRSFRLPRPGLDLPNGVAVSAIMRSVKGELLEPWPEDEDDPELRLQAAFEKSTAKLKQAEGKPTALGATAAARDVPCEGVPQPERAGDEEAVAALLRQPLSGQAPSLGEEIILRNGLRIFCKWTDLFDDEICFRGRRWGGLADHQSTSRWSKGVVSCEASVCSMAAMMLGICGLSVESLQECLEGKRVDPAPPRLEPFTTNLDASASPVDFETLMTLMHLLFMVPVEPGVTSRSRLSLVKLGLLAWRLGDGRDPQAQFRRRVTKCVTGDHPYTRWTSLWSILRLNFSKASAIFNERVSRPCEWTFVLVGKLPPREELITLLDKYLGSIPNMDRTGPHEVAAPSERQTEAVMRQGLTPLDVKFPDKSVREEVKLQMVDPKGSSVLAFPIQLANVAEAGSLQSAEAELKDLFNVRVLRKLLETRLIEVLRFKRGQVYGVSVSEDFSYALPKLGMPRKGTLSIGFECDPAEADEVVAATRAELRQLCNGEAAFTKENVDAARELERRDFEEAFLSNSWWASTLLDLYFSRVHAVTEEIGATVALWWRARAEVVESIDAEKACEVLRAMLFGGKGAEESPSVVVTMRPKRSWWSSAAPPNDSSDVHAAVGPSGADGANDAGAFESDDGGGGVDDGGGGDSHE